MIKMSVDYVIQRYKYGVWRKEEVTQKLSILSLIFFNDVCTINQDNSDTAVQTSAIHYYD